MSIDFFRFWILLVPSLLAYLVSGREIKIIYFVPFMWIAIDLCRSRFRFKIENKEILLSILIYLIIASISIASSLLQLNQRILFRDILIISSPCLLFLRNPESPQNPGTILFLVFAATEIVTDYHNFSFNLLQQFSIKDLVLPSEVATENNFGVVFGLFSLYFLMNKKWAWFAASIIFSLLVSKRALVMGFTVATTFWFVFRFKEKGGGKVKWYQLLLLYIFLGAVAIFLVEMGRIALDWLGLTDMRLDRFLMGRDGLLMILRENSMSFSLPSFFGHGPGTADTYLAFQGGGWGPLSDTPFNPHNDHMKLIYDYGYVGYLLFFFFLYNFYSSNIKSTVLLVYTMTVFCFDNSLIFIVYQIVAGFLCMEYRKEQRWKIKT